MEDPESSPADKFEGPPAIGRVLDLNETSCLRRHAVLGHDIVPMDDGPVPIYVQSFKEIVGYASVFVSGTSLQATIWIRRDHPLRLDLECGKKYWANAYVVHVYDKTISFLGTKIYQILLTDTDPGTGAEPISETLF